MSLQNLLKIGKLGEHRTDADQVGRLLASASRRNIEDSRQESISPESRLDIAYRAIMQVSMIALWANGYRPARPGRVMRLDIGIRLLAADCTALWHQSKRDCRRSACT